MPNVGPAELLVIFVVALLVVGPNKLPEIGRQVGRAMREFRRWQNDVRDELREIVDPAIPTTGGTDQTPTLPPAYEVPLDDGPGDESDEEPAEHDDDHPAPAPPPPAEPE